jgi:hypothetical protein
MMIPKKFDAFVNRLKTPFGLIPLETGTPSLHRSAASGFAPVRE